MAVSRAKKAVAPSPAKAKALPAPLPEDVAMTEPIANAAVEKSPKPALRPKSARGAAAAISVAKARPSSPAANASARGPMELDAKTTRALTDRLKRRPPAKPIVAAATAPAETGVIYVGHLPHGFYEEQMRPFFEQFGVVRRLRVSRSKKSAKPKGYAFVEFDEPEVARIVSDAMDGYLMFEKLLRVHVVAPGDVHADTFKGANRTFKKLPFKRQAVTLVNRQRSPAELQAQAQKLVAAEARQKRKLAAAGVDYEFPGYAHSLSAQTAAPEAKAEGDAGSRKRARTAPAAAEAAVKTGREAGASESGKGGAKAKAKAAAVVPAATPREPPAASSGPAAKGAKAKAAPASEAKVGAKRAAEVDAPTSAPKRASAAVAVTGPAKKAAAHTQPKAAGKPVKAAGKK